MKKLFLLTSVLLFAAACHKTPAQPEAQTAPTPSVAGTSTPETATATTPSLKIYLSDKGFAFQYPDLLTMTQTDAKPPVVYFKKEDATELEVRVQDGELDLNAIHSLFNSSDVSDSDVKTATVGTYAGYNYTESAGNHHADVYIVPQPNGAKPYVVTLIFYRTDGISSAITDNLKNAIVDSFMFENTK